jgi:hypothetical protein
MKSWRNREKLYTKRYARIFKRLLNSIWVRAAREYSESETFTVNDSDFLPVYRRLYTQIGEAEAKIAFARMPREKDIFDALATFFSGDPSSPEAITFVRSLMGDYFNVYVMERLREVSETTRKQIRAIIQRGFDEGLGARDRARLIRQAAPEINSTRAIRIARTESVTAANKAALLSHEASPYVYEKAWLPVTDKRTRPSHLAMDSNNFIPLWEDFLVLRESGGFDSMLAPGDTRASAENVINCRCVMVFKAKRGEDGRLVRKNSLQTV